MTVTQQAPAVIDLRDDEFTIPTPQPPPEPPAPALLRDRLRSRRRWVGLAAAAGVAVLIVQHLTGMLMADQRQRHLAHEVTVADPKINPGEPAMILQIPDIGVNLVVVEGASSHELQGGVGRVIGSAQLADGGNVIVAGRRFRFGAAFRRLAELGKGSAVVARSRAGLVRSYTVERVSRLGREDRRLLDARGDRLTLVTSGPGLLPDDRTVVVARADGPAPTAAATSTGRTAKLSLEALDERSTGVVGVGVGLLLLAAAAAAAVPALGRLRRTHRPTTIAMVMLPALSILLICAFVLMDSMFPSTL